MDTITSTIVTALTAGIGETPARRWLKDAYTALKSVLKRKYSKSSDVMDAMIKRMTII